VERRQGLRRWHLGVRQRRLLRRPVGVGPALRSVRPSVRLFHRPLTLTYPTLSYCAGWGKFTSSETGSVYEGFWKDGVKVSAPPHLRCADLTRPDPPHCRTARARCSCPTATRSAAPGSRASSKGRWSTSSETSRPGTTQSTDGPHPLHTPPHFVSLYFPPLLYILFSSFNFEAVCDHVRRQ